MNGVMLQPPINCGVFFTLLVGAHLGAVRDSACRSNHAVTKKKRASRCTYCESSENDSENIGDNDDSNSSSNNRLEDIMIILTISIIMIMLTTVVMM